MRSRTLRGTKSRDGSAGPPADDGNLSGDKPSSKIDLFSSAVINSLTAHIAVLDMNGRIMAINDAWKRFAIENQGGVEAIDIGANYFSECNRASRKDGLQEAKAAIAGIQNVMAGKSDEFEMEYECHSPDEKRWFLMRVTRMNYAGSKAVVSHIDITDKILIEQELSALHDVSRAIWISISMDNVTKATLEQISSVINPDMALVFLKDGEQLLLKGACPDPVFESHDIRNNHRVGQCLCGLSVSEKKSIFSDNIHADERCSWQECKSAGITSFAAIPLISRGNVIGTIGIASKEKRNFKIHRRFLESMAKDIAICLDNSILFEQTKVYASDLETQLVEREKIEKMLRQTQKMEAIGKLAGGIAHDFNNILSPILGYTEMTLSDLGEASPFYDNLTEVLNAGHRAKSLVQQILTFTRQSECEQHPIDISQPVIEALGLLRSTLPSTVDIVTHIAPDLSPVMGDSTQIYQVVINLCTNAAQAMEGDGGTLDVTLEQIYWDSKYIVYNKVLPRGYYIKLSVSDTGIGMTPDILESIFDPYFTTKEYGKGTGLGLAVVQGIVKNHKGEINVYSEPNRGSNFTIYLPITDDDLDSMDEAPDELPAGTESILYVDDEVAVVNLGKRLLEQLGYSVTAVTQSIDALQLLKADPDRFDVVVTDMTMPKIRGDQLALQMWRLRPGLPIIICTGFSSYITKEIAKEMGIETLLMKPYTQRELAIAVRKAIDA